MSVGLVRFWRPEYRTFQRLCYARAMSGNDHITVRDWPAAAAEGRYLLVLN
jgi:hypothetical protein